MFSSAKVLSESRVYRRIPGVHSSFIVTDETFAVGSLISVGWSFKGFVLGEIKSVMRLESDEQLFVLAEQVYNYPVRNLRNGEIVAYPHVLAVAWQDTDITNALKQLKLPKEMRAVKSLSPRAIQILSNMDKLMADGHWEIGR